jgi:hypothetical protein
MPEINNEFLNKARTKATKGGTISLSPWASYEEIKDSKSSSGSGSGSDSGSGSGSDSGSGSGSDSGLVIERMKARARFESMTNNQKLVFGYLYILAKNNNGRTTGLFKKKEVAQFTEVSERNVKFLLEYFSKKKLVKYESSETGPKGHNIYSIPKHIFDEYEKYLKEKQKAKKKK